MKFGVREICDVVFKATAPVTLGNTTFAAGQPVLYIDTAKTSNLEGAATTVYAQGGKGNSRLLAWEGEKTLTFTVEDAMLSPLGFSVLTGAGLLDASAAEPIKVHTTVEVPVVDFTAGATAGDTDSVVAHVTLADLDATGTVKVAVGASDPKVYGVLVDEAGAIIAHLGDAVITAGGTAGTPGTIDSTHDMIATFTEVLPVDIVPVEGVTRVVLDFYTIKESGVTEMQIEAGKFAGYYYVEASTLFRDQATGNDLPAEIIIPKAKIQSNFTFAMASTGDPSTFSFVMDAFPAPTAFSTKKVMCAIQIVGEDAVG